MIFWKTWCWMRNSLDNLTAKNNSHFLTAKKTACAGTGAGSGHLPYVGEGRTGFDDLCRRSGQWPQRMDMKMSGEDKPTKEEIILQVIVAVIGIALGVGAAWIWLWR